MLNNKVCNVNDIKTKRRSIEDRAIHVCCVRRDEIGCRVKFKVCAISKRNKLIFKNKKKNNFTKIMEINWRRPVIIYDYRLYQTRNLQKVPFFFVLFFINVITSN